MPDSEITITLTGDLPDIAFTDEFKSQIEKRVEESVSEELGEFEIWGELFGNDDNVYAMFLDKVELEQLQGQEDLAQDDIVDDLRKKTESLEKERDALEAERDELQCRSEKYSINELNIVYRDLPFCEHCGENHTDFGAEIAGPDDGTCWCLECFLSGNDLCDQDVEIIRKTLEKKRKAYFKKMAAK